MVSIAAEAAPIGAHDSAAPVAGVAAEAANPLKGVHWINGSEDCSKNTDPTFQQVSYDADTVVLRQNPCTSDEAPFIYLFFGKDKVYMQDTGASGGAVAKALREKVDQIVSGYEKSHGLKTPLKLIVGHSHGHGDHTAGDSAFVGRPNTTVIGLGPQDQAAAFGIKDWPLSTGKIDLGDRVLDVVPIPGHQPASVAVYDEKTKVLLTGDSLYPGRLYVADWNVYKASISRLHNFVKDHAVSQILGCHIEMNQTAGQDYPFGVQHHPAEHSLELNPRQLDDLDEQIQKYPTPKKIVRPDYIVWPTGGD